MDLREFTLTLMLAFMSLRIDYCMICIKIRDLRNLLGFKWIYKDLHNYEIYVDF